MAERIKEYLLWEKESLKTTKDSVDERNRGTLTILLYAMVAAYSGLLIFGVIKSGYSSYQFLFAFMLVYMLACLILVIKTPTLPALYLTYSVYIVTILLCLYASAFVDPDYINAEAYVFFLLFPILCFDSSIRIDTVSIVLSAIYLHTISEYKSGKALALEATTIVCFSLLGIIVGHFVRYRFLKAQRFIEERKQAELRDTLLGLPNHKCLLNDLSSLPTALQAVAFIRIDELCSPVLSFGLQYDERQLQELGNALKMAAEGKGISLYCCGSGIIGLVQPRIQEAVFQRLEPLHHLLKSFELYREAETVRLHFGIGASLCEGDIESALIRAADACTAAQEGGKNRIMIQDLV